MKIHPVGAELFLGGGGGGRRAVGQTHMTKLIVAFRSFVNAPKN
jgi:hypothetical protein